MLLILGHVLKSSRWPKINSVRIFGGLISYFKIEADWLNGSQVEQTEGQTDGRKDGWTGRQTDGPTDGPTDRWTGPFHNMSRLSTGL